MKQTFVVPIYRNDPNKYITHVVRSPLNSKRIARVYASCLHSGNIISFTETDMIGINVDGEEILPIDFPVSLLNTQYNATNIKDNPKPEEISFATKYPNFTAFPIDCPAQGSKIEISYKTSISDFVIVFECDDLPFSASRYGYKIEEFRRELNDWVIPFTIRSSHLQVNKIINTPGVPIAFSVRPVIYGLQPKLNMYERTSNGLLWGSRQTNPTFIYDFPLSWYKENYGLEHQKNILTEWLGLSTIDVFCGNGKQHFKNIDIPLLAPTASMPLAETFIALSTESKVLDVTLTIPKLGSSDIYRNDVPFTDACIQLIIKYQK